MRYWPIHEFFNKANKIFKTYSIEFCFLTPDSCTEALSAVPQKPNFNTSAGFSGGDIGVSDNDEGAVGGEEWRGMPGGRGELNSSLKPSVAFRIVLKP